MSSEGWRWVPLGDVAKDWKSTWKPENSGAETVDHYSIPAFDAGRMPSRERPADIKSNKRVVASDSILLSRLNPTTPRVWAPRLSAGRESVCSTEMMVLRPNEDLDRGFLHYLCWSPIVSSGMLQRVSGTTGSHQRVSPDDVLSLVVPVPGMVEQRAIAEVLGALDERIEWCHEVSRTARDLSRTIYRMAVERGGRQVPIDQVATVLFGAPFQSELFNDRKEGRPLIRIRDIAQLDASLYTTEALVSPVEIAPGDVVVGMDGEFRAEYWRGPSALLNQRVCTFRPKEGIGRSMVLNALELPLQLEEASISGTTVKHLGKRHIDRFVLTLPEDGSTSGVTCDLLLGVYVEAAAEMRNLQALRDALLPKFVSGEVRIPNPQALLESVG